MKKDLRPEKSSLLSTQAREMRGSGEQRTYRSLFRLIPAIAILARLTDCFLQLTPHCVAAMLRLISLCLILYCAPSLYREKETTDDSMTGARAHILAHVRDRGERERQR